MREGANDATRDTERAGAKRLPLSLSLSLSLALVRARNDAGYTQEQLAMTMKVRRNFVAGFESGERTPNLRHLSLAPDAIADAAIAELALIRSALGYAARQWVAAPEVVHDCEHARTASLVLELTDVLRARALGADRATLRLEIGQAIEALQEALAASEEQ